jgi:hypothetical protein
MNSSEPTPTTITDIDIPFARLVAIILKFMVASIPAVILFYLLFFIVAFFFMAIFGGGAALLNHLARPPLHLPGHF